MFIAKHRREAGESKEVAERDRSLQSAEADKGFAGQAGNETVVRVVGWR